MTTAKKNIRTLQLEELTNFFQEHGEKAFRAKQVWEWLWKKGARDFEQMTNLSLQVRTLLKDHFSTGAISIHSESRSTDGTIKIAFKLFDGHIIEGVLIPTKTRMTACISSQVGCSLACKFCATGKLGFTRNLEFYEIFDQVIILDEIARKTYDIPISNIVYMGMGEPLLNYENVLKSIEKITAEEGPAMSPKRITVSSVGIARKIKQLGKDKVKFNFALSLHAATDVKRNVIIPVNQKNTLQDLIEAVQFYHQETNIRPTIEYLMLKGYTDTRKDAASLAKFCRNFPVKINLIQYNPVDKSPYEDSGIERIEQFKAWLEEKNMVVNIRRSRGKDINAACGQLANKIVNAR